MLKLGFYGWLYTEKAYISKRKEKRIQMVKSIQIAKK